jgi:hypothetical protein
MADVAWAVEIIGDYARSGTIPVPVACHNPLRNGRKLAERGRCFYLAVLIGLLAVLIGLLAVLIGLLGCTVLGIVVFPP